MRDSNVVDHRNALAVLETDGSLTVITTAEEDQPMAMRGVRREQSGPHE
jgi:uncharacterized membrane protein YcaP (DUF421 family)